MSDFELADSVSTFITKIFIRLGTAGTFGMLKLLYNPEIREKATRCNDTTFPMRLIDFKGRAGRAEYFGLNIVVFLVAFLPMCLVSFLSGPYQNNNGNNLICLFPMAIFIIAGSIVYFATATRRCRDLSISPLVVILLWILPSIPCLGPLVGLILSGVLLFVPGDVNLFDSA